MAADELANIQQLTHGGENAEAYWSPDSKRLIFQSTRGESKCDQIYIMNADGSDQHMVSTGKGRTTCGYFLPDNKHILYASTHLAGDACGPDADHSKGYVWAVYPGFDIFEAKDDGTDVKRMTDTNGYDAEGTVNFKTNASANCLHLNGVGRSGSLDDEPRRIEEKADYQKNTAMTAARCSRTMVQKTGMALESPGDARTEKDLRGSAGRKISPVR